MGSTSAGEIESSVQSSPSGANTFEAFVKNAIQKIQREAWGRSSEVVEIRNACQSFLDYLNTEDGGAAKGVPFKEQSTRAALEPLKLACSCSIARIVEPALGCLHKLVAYAWIQGEGSETGNMDDGTLVSEIVSMVVKCTQLGNSSVYLAVIRALLTFATAEHFIAHGHCLLHMVRTVFNMAVSCEDNNIKRTSCNALLQMLNTVVKRVTVTQFQLTSHRSSLKSDVFDEPEGTTPKKQSLVETQSLSTQSEITPDPTGDQHSPDNPDINSSNEASSTWKLADLAEKEDIEALEAAFENKQRDMEEPLSPKSIPQGNDNSLNSQSASDAAMADSESTQNQSVQEPTPKKSKRPRGWDQLTVLEKDVLVVLMAFCKLAGVNTTISVGDMYVRQGKLLALELLVKVFENTGHRWENVRTEFCEQLRFPLCLVLIRNCTPTESKGFQFAIRLFVSVLMQRQIRLGLKPELGALYPLLLLRPLESDSLEPALLTVTLAAIKRISKEPQMQVDIFINYDCNLKAPNLYERTAKALSQLAVYGDPNATSNQSSILRDAAATCSMTMLASLDSWAGPVRDAANVGTNFTETSFSDGREPTSNGNGSIIGNTSEVRHFGAAKEKKNSFSLGIELFNKSPSKGIASLVASGVVLNQPDTIAGFLRKHKEQLDDAMLGEYLGLNDDMPLKVMYAFIDMEKYEGLTIDAALRKLLAQFRLPGEAQKIDRIMEKFAERFCQDNPGVFHSADNAYVLAFSLIMLNTDLHNPMAEKKLTKQDFISMNQRQESDGSFVEVLPVSELESIFDRIAMNEIQTSANSNLSLKKLEDALALHRTLASAVGLTQLALPFRSGKVWDKIRGAQIEHEHLLAMTQKAMRSGTVDADLWFTATHTEHSRPMFEVAGPYFHKALTAAMESAVDKESAEKSVSSLVMAIHLAALLGLDTLCQQFVSTLCRAIGVHTKEALIRTNPARQICALRALIGVASDDQAGLLGNSWALILRTISSVEALITDMRRSHKSDQSVFEESMQALKFQSFDRKDHDRSSAIGRFFNQIGLVRAESDLYSSVAPGQAIRLWSEGEGVTEMDRIFVRSASLDGEAVVIFCKALCLISQEELTPGISHLEAMSPRVFSLRKLVECAYYNLGRIRLIWGRLWSTIASHLVNASCHSDQTVAMYSVDSLRQLVGKLLSRDELANFTTQSDTLKPFVMVLKQCANVVVRELAVQCIEQAMNTHSSRLGSGWMIVLEFLTVASLDPAPSVTRQCLDTLHSVISVHWRKWGRGRDALADCVNVALRVARNPHNLDCSLRAIQLIKSSADELVIELGGAYDNHVETNRSISVDYSHNETPTELPRTSSVPNAPTLQQEKKEAAAAAAANQVEPLLNRSALWTMVFESLVEIITREERRRCADLAADVLFSFIQTEFVRTWDRATWNAFFSVALVKVFDQRENAYSMESGLDRILSYSTSFFPALWSAVASNYDKNGKLLLAHLMDVLVGWMENSREAVALSGVYLFQDLVDGVSKNLDKDGWRVVLENLRFAWTVCVGGKKPVTSTEKDSESILDQPFKSWTDKIDHTLALPQLKTRCQVLISLQRVMHRIHEQNGQLLSLEMLSELTDLILDAVQQVTEANKDAKFIKALRSCLMDTNENTSQVHPQRIQSFEQSEIQVDEQEESQEAPEGALVKLPSLKVDPSQSSPMQSSSSPPVEDIPQLKKIVHSDESVFHGLLKLQIEGGVLTIEALKRQALYKGENDQLYSFCRKVITQASSEIRSLVANSGHEGMDSHWEQAIKAPLISKAFEIFQEAEGEVLLKELKELGPHLSTLICSRELSIRQSVANFLKLKSSTIFDLTM